MDILSKMKGGEKWAMIMYSFVFFFLSIYLSIDCFYLEHSYAEAFVT